MKEIKKKIDFDEIEKIIKQQNIDLSGVNVKDKILELFSDIAFLYNNGNINPFVSWKCFTFLIDDNQLFFYIRKGNKIIKQYFWNILAD